ITEPGAVAGIISPSACALRQDASYSPNFLARGVQFENAMTAMTKAYFIAVAPTSGLRIGHDQWTSGVTVGHGGHGIFALLVCPQRNARVDMMPAHLVSRASLAHGWDCRPQITAEYLFGGLWVLVIGAPVLVRCVERVDLNFAVRVHRATFTHECRNGRSEITHRRDRLVRRLKPSKMIAVFNQALQSSQSPVEYSSQFGLQPSLQFMIFSAKPGLRDHQQQNASHNCGRGITEPWQLVTDDVQSRRQLPSPLVAVFSVYSQRIFAADRQ